jgi:FKBP-type peptidyl-prolyl cis-trans isomerase SlyD
MVEQIEQVTTDKVVSIHYALISSQGKLLARSGQNPLPYLHGHGTIVRGLERQIEGRSAGDKFQAVVPPEEGYGKRLPDARRQLPRDTFPEGMPLVPGKKLSAPGPDGTMISLWVVDASGEQVVVDLNHPLAGQTLTFDIEVVAIRDASEQELKQGRPRESGAPARH